MSEDPKIIWEKWRDPYGYDDILDINEHILNQEDDPENFIDAQDETTDEKTQNIKNISDHFFKPKMPFMFTPMGIIPYTENTACSKLFNFWTGHTNFNISNKICDIIENAEGIETFDIFTRYRFRIGIGKAFVDSIIMRDINNHIYQFFLE